MSIRSRSTDLRNGGFSQAVIDQVWQKGRIDSRYSPNEYRYDICGKWMKYDLYGKQEKYGWEIDHIKPVSKGGTDELSNLQPLMWENNRKKADTYPWNC